MGSSQTKIIAFGNRRAFLYDIVDPTSRQLRSWIYLWDTAGNEAHIQLPDIFDNNTKTNISIALTSDTDLWMWSGVTDKTALRHYRLSGSGALPDTATLQLELKASDIKSIADV